MDVHHPLITLGTLELQAWTPLGRLPVAVVLLSLAWWVGRRAGWRRGALALSGACAGLAFGVALLPSVLGAIFGMLLLGGLTLLATGAPTPGPTRLAAGLLGLIGVGRFGCLLGGCCFGVPTDLPWGVTHGAGSTPATFHALLGLVEPGQGSLHVHPVQAYEGLAALALLLALPWLTRLLRSGLAGALAAAAGYLLVRVAVDPLRAMVNTSWSMVPVGPLSAFQAAALATALACLAAAVAVARRAGPAHDRVVVPAEPHPARLVLILCAQGAGAWLGLPLLGPFLAALVTATLVASTALIVQLVLAGEAGRTPRRHLAAAMVVALLAPIGLRATERSLARTTNAWIYAPMPGAEQVTGGGSTQVAGSDPAAPPASPFDPSASEPGRLVRIGDQSTPEAELEARAAQLAPGTTRRLYGHVGGSSMNYDVIQQGCGQDYLVKTASRSWVEAGMAFESVTRLGDQAGSQEAFTWQLRGSFRQSAWSDQLANTTYSGTGTPSTVMVPGGSGRGARYVVGGMAQFDTGPVSLGLGGLVGRDHSHDPDGPAFTSASGKVLYPGGYLRLGGRSFGVEGGTMALFQPSEAPFAGFYFGQASSFRLRLGGTMPYPKSDLPSSFALSIQVPVRSAVVQVGASMGSGIEGTLRIGFPLP